VVGLLALVGGDEFKPGNEEQDRLLVAAARPGPAFIVPTAAARQHPDAAVVMATRWFGQLGLELEQLAVLTRTDANSKALAEQARAGGFFYLAGGDPGLVVQVLQASRVWNAMVEAWREGAALAGSSAGAMALCSHTLIRAGWPNRFNRKPNEALGLVPNTAVLPHYDTFGLRWVESARSELPEATLLGIDERSAALYTEGGWRAAGPGAVTVIRGDQVSRFTSGMKVTDLSEPNRMLASQ
jgi:cyanophycinase